ncbi:MAG: homocysteine S-methyltransferase family protein [Mycobacteriales bacterium]
MLSWVTDGGLETDLIFHKGLDLPEFASFPLVEQEATAQFLRDYYLDYAQIAQRAGAGLVLETPTWRANPDWGKTLGYDANALDRINQQAVELVRSCGADVSRVMVSGVIGPRGDGYIAAGSQADEAADYHRGQVASFAKASVDVVHAMTINEPAEAIGVIRAARGEGVPVGISFTVETDGRLPDGTPLRQAIEQVDAVAAPDWYGINCAHPTHVRPALDGGDWQERLRWFRPNASTMTHKELDAMEVLDEGDRNLLVTTTADLLQLLPSITTLGGCCGTDASHVAALWAGHHR